MHDSPGHEGGILNDKMLINIQSESRTKKKKKGGGIKTLSLLDNTNFLTQHQMLKLTFMNYNKLQNKISTQRTKKVYMHGK